MIPVRITVNATMPLPIDSDLSAPMAALDQHIDGIPGVFTQWGTSRVVDAQVSLTVQACAGIVSRDATEVLQHHILDATLAAGVPNASVAIEQMAEADVVVGSPLAVYLAVIRANRRMTVA